MSKKILSAAALVIVANSVSAEIHNRPEDAGMPWVINWVSENGECMSVISLGLYDNIRLPLKFEVDEEFYSKEATRNRVNKLSNVINSTLRYDDFTTEEKKYYKQVTYNIGMETGVVVGVKVSMGQVKDVDTMYRNCLKTFDIE